MEDVERYFVTCPFDRHHRMLPGRLAKHLINCKRQHPDIKLVQCSFNSTHFVPEEELKNHHDKCEFRQRYELFLNPDKKSSSDSNLLQCEAPCSVDWDKEPKVESYNPGKQCRQDILSNVTKGLTPSERRLKREQDRIRLMPYFPKAGPSEMPKIVTYDGCFTEKCENLKYCEFISSVDVDQSENFKSTLTKDNTTDSSSEIDFVSIKSQDKASTPQKYSSYTLNNEVGRESRPSSNGYDGEVSDLESIEYTYSANRKTSTLKQKFLKKTKSGVLEDSFGSDNSSVKKATRQFNQYLEKDSSELTELTFSDESSGTYVSAFMSNTLCESFANCTILTGNEKSDSDVSFVNPKTKKYQRYKY